MMFGRNLIHETQGRACVVGRRLKLCSESDSGVGLSFWRLAAMARSSSPSINLFSRPKASLALIRSSERHDPATPPKERNLNSVLAQAWVIAHTENAAQHRRYHHPFSR